MTDAVRQPTLSLTIASRLGGFALCGGIAALSMIAGSASATPPVLIALIIGMALAHLVDVSPAAAGTEFTARAILRLGIAFLGVRLSIDQIAALGASAVLISAGAVLLMLSAGTGLALLLGMPRSRSILSAGAVGICGASAALAISTVLPADPARERQTIATVALATALSTIAMLLYPMIALRLGFDQIEAAIFFGASIHDVSQVAGAGAMISPDAASAAVATKLVRVACLAPAVAAILFLSTRFGTKDGQSTPPRSSFFFLIGFALMAAGSNLGAITGYFREGFSQAATFCLVAATAALGLKSSIGALMSEGWRPLIVMVVQTLLLAAYVIGAIHFLRI
ncbi:MAG: putative sulfate exporter family transporter [Sphingomonas sp.]|uniref:YeiH family protein n=1 Tax=Sphingomonas sp. TaxID=28214 RepID=UPI0026047BEB|nr:putative sulfate exporter family transporter [Sphingomonas sp.]MDK2770529.1 putative sulfate exporter family transporter [Sphingomonas sp.]